MNDDALQQDRQRLAQLLTLAGKEAEHLVAVRKRLFGDLTVQGIDADWLTNTLATPEGIDRLESFGAKFSRLQDTMMDKLLPHYLRTVGERIGTVIDNLNRAEQLGLVKQVDDWIAMRRLRNRLVHEYIDEPQVMVEALRSTYDFVDQLQAAYDALRKAAAAS